MIKNGIKNKRIYNFIIIWLVLLVGVSVLVFTNTKTPLRAETNYYSSLSSISKNYILDYTTPQTTTKNGLTITNNQDGTFSLSGRTTAVTTYDIPISLSYEERFCNEFYNGTYYTSGCGLLINAFVFNTTTLHLYGAQGDLGPSLSIKMTTRTTNATYSNIGQFGSNQLYLVAFHNVEENVSGYIDGSANYEKKISLYFSSNVDYSNYTLLPFVIDNVAQTMGTAPYTYTANAMFEYLSSIVGPKPNNDVYYAVSKPQAGYYIYQKVNAQFGVDLLPAIRYTLTADTTEITKDSALTLESANIDILKLTAPNGNIYRVYYDNITSSNTKDSYFVEDNGTTTILQNADGSGLINSTGLDALILALQHALTYNAIITTADHYIFNLCSYLYVFDTDFGYAKGVQEGSANYQPGQPGYTSIYDAGVDYGEQQKDLYYNSYYGGSDGVGGAGYTSIYNAGVEAGADISVNWVFKCMSAVGSFLSIEILPNITFGALIGIPFIITLAWFIIRQLRGGGGS